MADPIKHAKVDYEAHLASVSLAGIRPLVQATRSPTASAEATYTISDIRCNRVILYHTQASAEAIRVELNATANATKMPITQGVYFVMEVEQNDVVHLFNTHASPVTVYIMEIR